MHFTDPPSLDSLEAVMQSVLKVSRRAAAKNCSPISISGKLEITGSVCTTDGRKAVSH